MIMSYSNNTITSDVHNYLDIFQNIHETSVMIHEVNEAFELLHHASISKSLTGCILNTKIVDNCNNTIRANMITNKLFLSNIFPICSLHLMIKKHIKKNNAPSHRTG